MHRRCPRIEVDDLSLLNFPDGSFPDRSFPLEIMDNPLVEWLFDANVRYRDGAAVSTFNEVSLGKSRQVAPDSRRRYLEACGEFVDRQSIVLRDKIRNSATALLGCGHPMIERELSACLIDTRNIETGTCDRYLVFSPAGNGFGIRAPNLVDFGAFVDDPH
ncbi:hypothetical protein GCM10008995_21120 [Halobellus salinus]|uniref:Uncharacterized protein n=1 Tax=Halobellus salinus TaxID=931585 RepID=A0A830EH08_9EURY|nr:hypothetical protein GCM10008995_21120 [Halobellus salinus]